MVEYEIPQIPTCLSRARDKCAVEHSGQPVFPQPAFVAPLRSVEPTSSTIQHSDDPSPSAQQVLTGPLSIKEHLRDGTDRPLRPVHELGIDDWVESGKYDIIFSEQSPCQFYVKGSLRPTPITRKLPSRLLYMAFTHCGGRFVSKHYFRRIFKLKCRSDSWLRLYRYWFKRLLDNDELFDAILHKEVPNGFRFAGTGWSFLWALPAVPDLTYSALLADDQKCLRSAIQENRYFGSLK